LNGANAMCRYDFDFGPENIKADTDDFINVYRNLVRNYAKCMKDTSRFDVRDDCVGAHISYIDKACLELEKINPTWLLQRTSVTDLD